MIAVARAAVPWRLIAAVCALVAGCMALASGWPDRAWPLQGVAVGLVAAAAAWTMDEPCAAVVDALPRGLAWRTCARAAGLVPPLATWVACVTAAGDRLPPHAAFFLLQGAAAALLGFALAAWRRHGGIAAAGTGVALAAIPVAALVAVARPLPDHLPLFPVWPQDPWAHARSLWIGAAAAGALVLAATLGRSSHPRPR